MSSIQHMFDMVRECYRKLCYYNSFQCVECNTLSLFEKAAARHVNG
jgi:hypothetical protein